MIQTLRENKPMQSEGEVIMNKHNAFAREYLNSYADCARLLRKMFHW